MKLKDAKIGDIVTVTGKVVQQHNGQTLLLLNGVGRSAQWSAVNSADCQLAWRDPEATP